MLVGSGQGETGSGQGSGQDAPEVVLALNQFEDQMDRICYALGLKHPTHLTKYIKRSQSAISQAFSRKIIPQSWLSILNHKYNISIQWILDGTGPMKVGEATQDLGVPMAAVKKSPESPSFHGAFKVSEDLTAAAEVLESGTAYATALHLNIQQFHRAIKDQTGIQRLQQTITDQAEITRVQGETIRAQSQTIAALQSTMAKESEAMRKEVEELKSQLARLLATGEDNPDHGQEVA